MNTREEMIDSFTQSVTSACGDNVVSMVLYGSAVSEEYDPKKTELTFLVVLKDASVDALKVFKGLIAPWKKQHIALPLVLDKAYIASSLDTFPIEFLNMKAQYIVCFGENVFEALTFKKEDVRLQCERELKGKSLRLRQVYMETIKPRDLIPVIHNSLFAFIAVFRGMLELAGRDVPVAEAGVVADMCAEYHLEEAIFEKLLQVQQGTLKLKDTEITELFEAYAREIRSLSQKVDALG